MTDSGTEQVDVLIAGGGPAGMSAALWCSELGLKSIVTEQSTELGGQLLWTYNEIRNHLGGVAVDGRSLRDLFLSQLSGRNFGLVQPTAVTQLEPGEGRAMLSGEREIYFRYFVLATGVRRRTLGVEREDYFVGRGIIDSGKKAAASVAGRDVVIVGGGDAAFENVLILREFARSVTLVHRRREFSARDEFVKPVLADPKITILTDSAVTTLGGESRLASVEITNLVTGDRKSLPADVLLRRIGVAPNSEIVRGLVDCDAAGYVKVDGECRTSSDRIFAIGDVANRLAPTVSSAVGMGATAAKVIYSLASHR